jgi:hypothetical protein
MWFIVSLNQIVIKFWRKIKGVGGVGKNASKIEN